MDLKFIRNFSKSKILSIAAIFIAVPMIFSVISCGSAISDEILEQTTGKVQFISNSELFGSPTYSFPLGKTYTEFPVPEKKGRTFEGWYSDESLTNKITSITITKTLQVIYGKWNSLYFSINYEMNGGGTNSASNPTTFTADDTVTLANPTPLDASKPFLGWYLSSSGYKNTANRISGWKPETYYESKTVYARWPDGIAELRHITYEPSSEITNDRRNFDYYESDEEGELYPATLNAYSEQNFLGWFSDSDGNTKVTNLNQLGNGDATIYAKFSGSITYQDYYGTTFSGKTTDENGNTLLSSYMLGKSTALPNPVYSDDSIGASFEGWYLNDSKISAIPSTQTGNITLKSKWKNDIQICDKATGTLNYVYGTFILGQETTLDFNANPPSDPNDTDAAYGGAYSDQNDTVFTSIAATQKEKAKVFIKWLYNISFLDEGGTNYSGDDSSSRTNITYQKNTDYDPGTPTKSGYTFKGWFETSDCSGTAVTTIRNKGNTNLYAKWEAASQPSSNSAYSHNETIPASTISSLNGSIPSSGSYAVSSIADIQALASYNDQTNFTGVTLVLSTDITLETLNPISPIGTSAMPFKGVINGNGYTLTVTNPNNSYQSNGLVAYAGTGSAFKNLIIKGSTGSSGVSGAIVGTAKGNISIDNCVSYSDVSSDGGEYVGGIIGKWSAESANDKITIKNCINLGSVRGVAHVGGILGGADSSVVGELNIQNCANYGNIQGSSANPYTGGITGGASAAGDAYDTILIENCLDDAVLNTISGSTDPAALISVTTNNTMVSYGYYNTANSCGTGGSLSTNQDVVSYTSSSTAFTLSNQVTIGSTPSTDVLSLMNAWINSQSSSSEYFKWEWKDGKILIK